MTSARKLRLFMTADAVGGVWQYALDLARGLAEHDVATTLAVLGPAPDDDQVAAAAGVPDLHLVQTDLPLDWTATSPDEVADAAAAIATLADDSVPDVVHLNSAALGAGARFAFPLVIACHSCMATWWSTVHAEPLPEDFIWRAKLVQQGYLAADALIAPTAAFAKITARTYGLKATPGVVHNGRRLAVDRPRRPSFASSFAFTAGRLWDEGKNVAAIDRAAARLAIPVLAAGPLAGPNGTEISLQHVRTLGRLSDGDIARWLKPAPVFVSAAHYEPFGLAVLEAAQACCPLVLSDIASFRELWDGAALFLPPDDERAIAAAIEGIVKDATLRAELGAAARERSRRYSVDAMAAGMIAIYRWLAPNDAGASASYQKVVA
jgi:glycosyltransferase involved in cell wall biosynthesis